MQLKRIFMNEEDGSPGGAAPPPAPAAPTASNAAPQAEPTVPVSQLKSVIAETFSELRNGLFADLRKAGALGKEKAAPAPDPTPTPTQSSPAAAPASTGLSAADVQSMLVQERVFARAEAEHKLTDTQMEWMRSALKAVPVDELPTKASAFLRSMGIAKGAPEPSTTTTQPVVQSTQPPISDKGAPSPGGVTPWQRELAENPIGMSPASVNAMVAELGVDVARKKIVEAGMRQAERIRLQVKAPQQR